VHARVFHGGKRIGCDRQARDSAGERAQDLAVVEGHLDALVAVLVVHVVDDVERPHVLPGQPPHHALEGGFNFRVIEDVAANGRGGRGDLDLLHLIDAAVDGVKQGFAQVGPGTEKLHLFTDAHGGHAAGNRVVIAQIPAHQVVVLILQRTGFNRGACAELFEPGGKAFGPEDRQVGLGGGTKVMERLQEAKTVLGHQCAPIDAHAAQRLGNPGGIAAKKLIVLLRAGETHQTKFEHELVDELLRGRLGKDALGKVALDVNVEEGGDAADGHGGAVLLFDGGEVGEIRPLHGLGGICCGAGQVKTVGAAHRA